MSDTVGSSSQQSPTDVKPHLTDDPKQFTHASQFVAEALAGNLHSNPRSPASPIPRSDPTGMSRPFKMVRSDSQNDLMPKAHMMDLRTCIDDIIDSATIRHHLMVDNDSSTGKTEKYDFLSRLCASEAKDDRDFPSNDVCEI